MVPLPMTHDASADRPRRRAPLRGLLALIPLGAIVAIAASVATGAVFHSAYYSCSASNKPGLTSVGTTLSNSATISATVDPHGVPTVVTYVSAGTLTTHLDGNDNDLIYWAKAPGDIKVTYLNAGANVPLSASAISDG